MFHTSCLHGAHTEVLILSWAHYFIQPFFGIPGEPISLFLENKRIFEMGHRRHGNCSHYEANMLSGQILTSI